MTPITTISELTEDDIADPVAWTTEGSVRGTCGHRHRTEEAAARCLERERRAMARLSSGLTTVYSDRRVVPLYS